MTGEDENNTILLFIA